MLVEAPVTAATHRWLRSLVLAHHDDEHRRRHPPALHTGVPGSPRSRLVLDAEVAATLDQTLRTDLWAGLIVRRRFAARRRGEWEDVTPWLWLTRQGGLTDDDLDHTWAAAARAAAKEAGLACRFVVVVRNGWRDPVSGVSRQWVRLRRRT